MVVDARAVHLTEPLDVDFGMPQYIEERHAHLPYHCTVYDAFNLALFIHSLDNCLPFFNLRPLVNPQIFNNLFCHPES